MHIQKRKSLFALTERNKFGRSNSRQRPLKSEIPHTYKSKVRAVFKLTTGKHQSIQEVKTNG